MVAAQEAAAQEVAGQVTGAKKKKKKKSCVALSVCRTCLSRGSFTWCRVATGAHVRSVFRKFPPKTATCAVLKTLFFCPVFCQQLYTYKFALSGM